MSRTRLLIGAAIILSVFAGCARQPSASGEAKPAAIKLGFIVNQPDQPWYQLEWKFAEQAGRDLGVEIIKIGATDGEKALAAIDTIAAAGGKGFVICTPDVRLGPAIVARAKAANLKLIAVDDQFVGPGGLMKDVHYLGVSARQIGVTAAQAALDEMKRRGWRQEDTGVAVITYDQLDTTRERTEAATEVVRAAGFPAQRIFRAAARTGDVPGAFDAANVLFVRAADVKQWLVLGPADNFVLGAVRALEGRGVSERQAIAVGINGTDCIAEFEKPTPTAFFASVLLAPKRHGYDTVAMLHRWVTTGQEPPLDTRTAGVLITRETFAQVLKEQGIR
ncbi:MAG TPA: substrate-binding domain-containing protein [Opitutaceae bacterium]|nr:substrate-binding domain-containing protein [Opitutaceae bacterium]